MKLFQQLSSILIFAILLNSSVALKLRIRNHENDELAPPVPQPEVFHELTAVSAIEMSSLNQALQRFLEAEGEVDAFSYKGYVWKKVHVATSPTNSELNKVCQEIGFRSACVTDAPPYQDQTCVFVPGGNWYSYPTWNDYNHYPDGMAAVNTNCFWYAGDAYGEHSLKTEGDTHRWLDLDNDKEGSTWCVISPDDLSVLIKAAESGSRGGVDGGSSAGAQSGEAAGGAAGLAAAVEPGRQAGFWYGKAVADQITQATEAQVKAEVEAFWTKYKDLSNNLQDGTVQAAIDEASNNAIALAKDIAAQVAQNLTVALINDKQKRVALSAMLASQKIVQNENNARVAREEEGFKRMTLGAAVAGREAGTNKAHHLMQSARAQIDTASTEAGVLAGSAKASKTVHEFANNAVPEFINIATQTANTRTTQMLEKERAEEHVRETEMMKLLVKDGLTEGGEQANLLAKEMLLDRESLLSKLSKASAIEASKGVATPAAQAVLQVALRDFVHLAAQTGQQAGSKLIKDLQVALEEALTKNEKVAADEAVATGKSVGEATATTVAHRVAAAEANKVFDESRASLEKAAVESAKIAAEKVMTATKKKLQVQSVLIVKDAEESGRAHAKIAGTEAATVEANLVADDIAARHNERLFDEAKNITKVYRGRESKYENARLQERLKQIENLATALGKETGQQIAEKMASNVGTEEGTAAARAVAEKINNEFKPQAITESQDIARRSVESVNGENAKIFLENINLAKSRAIQAAMKAAATVAAAHGKQVAQDLAGKAAGDLVAKISGRQLDALKSRIQLRAQHSAEIGGREGAMSVFDKLQAKINDDLRTSVKSFAKQSGIREGQKLNDELQGVEESLASIKEEFVAIESRLAQDESKSDGPLQAAKLAGEDAGRSAGAEAGLLVAEQDILVHFGEATQEVQKNMLESLVELIQREYANDQAEAQLLNDFDDIINNYAQHTIDALREAQGETKSQGDSLVSTVMARVNELRRSIGLNQKKFDSLLPPPAPASIANVAPKGKHVALPPGTAAPPPLVIHPVHLRPAPVTAPPAPVAPVAPVKPASVPPPPAPKKL